MYFNHVTGLSDLGDLWVIKIKKPTILCARRDRVNRARNAELLKGKCQGTAHVRSLARTGCLAKITIATKRKVSLLGSQAVKLISQGKIAVIGEDLQYFW